jgi:hypothetical protein
VATGALGVTTLIGLRELKMLAMSRITDEIGPVFLTLYSLNALVAVLIPIVLFLLGRYVNPDENERIESVR